MLSSVTSSSDTEEDYSLTGGLEYARDNEIRELLWLTVSSLSAVESNLQARTAEPSTFKVHDDFDLSPTPSKASREDHEGSATKALTRLRAAVEDLRGHLDKVNITAHHVSSGIKNKSETERRIGSDDIFLDFDEEFRKSMRKMSSTSV
ncbi:MAG: hypothetical protein M1824_004782 [Vezdaea acicularis]|nr:MAG: hypothetical protein M1824_004782 [Vezdaea acicularis]